MQLRTVSTLLTSIAILSAIPSLASATRLTLRADRVIPVIVDEDLSIKNNRKGDRFTATVKDDRDLPAGTRFEGRIVNIYKKNDDHPAYMDLEFTDIRLPDGTRASIDSKPISLSNAKKDRDGRFTANKQTVSKSGAVLGGTGAGLIIGALLKKPFEGAFIGALAGIIVAEASAGDKYSNGEVALKKGSKIGALITRDVTVNYDDRTRRDDDREIDRYDDRDRDRDNRDNRNDRDNRDSRGIQITYRDKDLNFDRDEAPFWQGDTLMVSLEAAARELGLEVDRSGKTIYVEDDDDSLKIEQDSKAFRLNGKKGNLASAVIERDGILYIPIEILAKLKEEPIYANGARIKN